MDLNLELSIPARKRAPLTAEVVRELREEDLVLLETVDKGVKSPPIKRLSERHHALARLLASGVPPGEAALIAQYDPSRVSILQADPSFKELLEFYRRDFTKEYADMHARLAGLSLDAINELRDRLEESPDAFSNTMLLELVTKAADRSGHGPASSTTNVNVNLNLADRMREARQAKQEAMKVIEGKSKE